MRMIRKAAVLGSGIMGSQIAALLASAGLPVYLLDIVPPDAEPGDSRSRLAEEAIGKLKKMSPSPVMHPSALSIITPGNLEDDLHRLAGVDWIIEAVVERLDVKKSLWARVGEVARPGTILSTNTSGLSCTAQAEALPPEHRHNFLGTHFFNPPRYMKLLEIIPVPDTDPEVLAFMKNFAEKTLGKGVVVCNDTPNFIANRIGTYGLAVTLKVMQEMNLGINAVDTITGIPMGRPKSATFRTLDLVGLDTFAHVASNLAETTNDPEERELMTLPPFICRMLEEKRLGEKTGQGFYRKLKSGRGESQILTLDLHTMGYGPSMNPIYPILEQTRRIKDPGERIKTLVNSPDEAGRFAWRIISPVLAFCARKLQEEANGDPNAVDRAMRWGYNWDIGPFEAWNTMGVQETAQRMKADGLELPDWVETLDRFPVDRIGEEPLSFTVLKADKTLIVKQTPSVTLVDLGDEVLGMELHGMKQSIGEDFMPAANAAAEEVCRNWRGLVVSASAPNFSVGFNAMLILLSAQAQQWALIERTVKALQDSLMGFKYLARPVVVAPYGMTLGGGCEIAMQSARTVAAAETYMGLVEVGLGLIPAGGGTKEMAVRAAQMMPPAGSQMPNRAELISYIAPAFEYAATAKVSTSAAEARDLGFLRPTDEIVMNRDHLLAQAKEVVLELDLQGYIPPQPGEVPVAGPDGRAVLELAAFTLKNSGLASEYDAHVANKLAYVITGGNLPAGTLVPEQYLLDLEREAFLGLVGQQKTQERIMHMLQKNKPLRN